MANVFDVAKYILRSIGGQISTLKLQKLCYYAQATRLAWEGVPLFQEEFLRWDNGPVCRELFDVHKGHTYVSSKIIEASRLSESGLSLEEESDIEEAIEDYGQYSGRELSDMTHLESPWLNTQKNEIISKDLIKDYYYSLLPEDEKDEHWIKIIEERKDEPSISAEEAFKKIDLED